MIFEILKSGNYIAYKHKLSQEWTLLEKSEKWPPVVSFYPFWWKVYKKDRVKANIKEAYEN